MSGSTQCPHLEFDFSVRVDRFEDEVIKMADVSGRCRTCGRPVRFRGDLAIGVDWDNPTLDYGRATIRLPVVVEGDEVDESKRRPGFRVNLAGEGEGA